MKIQNNTQNHNFKGYKNLIFDDIQSGNARITYFAAQLTDEGRKDLSEFRKIIDSSLIKEKHDLNRDVISFVSVKIPSIKETFIALNTEQILPIEELIECRDTAQNAKNMAEIKQFQQEEKFVLKAFTLIADITKRISEESLANKDDSLANVASTLFKDFQKIFGNTVDNIGLLTRGLSTNVEQQKVALLFNQYIKKSMNLYFK